MGGQLHRQAQPQILYSVFALRHRTPHTTQLASAVVWISLAIDALQSWKLLAHAREEVAITLATLAGIAAFLLFLSIGVLLVTQCIITSINLTTLESFVSGAEEQVLKI
jgi:hypothetical protein